MKIIKLYGGSIALVDDEDAYLAEYRWYLQKFPSNAYARGRMGLRAENSQPILMHVVILESKIGHKLGSMDCDHVNGIGLDNRRDNLRQATRSQNRHNSVKPKNSRSQFKGVTWHNLAKRWYARFSSDGKVYELGTHRTEEEAARAYDAKAWEVQGSFARLNFPDMPPMAPSGKK